MVILNTLGQTIVLTMAKRSNEFLVCSLSFFGAVEFQTARALVSSLKEQNKMAGNQNS